MLQPLTSAGQCLQRSRASCSQSERDLVSPGEFLGALLPASYLKSLTGQADVNICSPPFDRDIDDLDRRKSLISAVYRFLGII